MNNATKEDTDKSMKSILYDISRADAMKKSSPLP